MLAQKVDLLHQRLHARNPEQEQEARERRGRAYAGQKIPSSDDDEQRKRHDGAGKKANAV